MKSHPLSTLPRGLYQSCRKGCPSTQESFPKNNCVEPLLEAMMGGFSSESTPAPLQGCVLCWYWAKALSVGILLPPPLAAYVKPCISHCSLWDLGVESGMEEIL